MWSKKWTSLRRKCSQKWTILRIKWF